MSRSLSSALSNILLVFLQCFAFCTAAPHHRSVSLQPCICCPAAQKGSVCARKAVSTVGSCWNRCQNPSTGLPRTLAPSKIVNTCSKSQFITHSHKCESQMPVDFKVVHFRVIAVFSRLRVESQVNRLISSGCMLLLVKALNRTSA